MKRGKTPTIWQEMENIQREMNRLFETAYDGSPMHLMSSSVEFPAINVWSKADSGQVVTAEIPGVGMDDLDIKVAGEILTISGSRPTPVDQENYRLHRQERGFGTFSRSIQLPFPIEVEKVEATYEKGILKIWLPRAEYDQPRKILVKVN
ncbi:MAG: Hsp20/alpha crystallin family protein [Chloroflexi bacterium HGW-Chloroflexi-10]|nr:MAG: Hsp20/alpha crystallin family protein [Chloroflexi bacterium HGW-Chloroflexi-10]